MTFLRTTALSSALVVMASPTLAQVSAEQVWNDWKEILGNYGMDVSTASENVSGGNVTVSGAVLGFSMPEGTVSMELGDMTFTDQGGRVAITMADEAPMRMNFDVEGETGTVTMVIRQPGNEVIASGSPDAIRYDFVYPSLSITDFNVEGEDIPADFPAVINVIATDLSGFMAMKDGDVRNYDSVMSMATMAATIDVDIPEEEGGGGFAMEFNISDLQQTTSGALGMIDMAMSAAEMIQGGMNQTGTATHGAATYNIDIDGPDGAMTIAAGASSGTLELDMTDAGISYGGTTNDVTLSLSGDMIPFPVVNLSMEQSGGLFTMPVVPGDEPQDFALVMRMVGLEIDDMIWSMFDPDQQLPRDPATLIVDLGGKATVLEDFTAPEYAENPAAGVPGTLEEVKVNALQLTLAGAELTGTGDFAFDNSMGIPVPSGTADLSLSGANTLMDTLVNMGLLPQEQAMGARMMLGMFARPGPGEDTLTSQIEMTPDGQILANGQRIR